MQRFLSKNILINISFFAFVVILLNRFIKHILTGYTKDSWGITEFLINYQGGFVRRGLLGEILLSIYNTTGISPYSIIISTCILAYIALATFFVRSIIKQGYPLVFLPFVFFLGNPIINNFWVRKDVILVLLFIAAIYWADKKSNISLIFYNLFLSIALLIHESIGFFCLPILCLLLCKEELKQPNGYFKTILTSIYKLVPSILVFLCVIYFKGSKLVADKIWDSWKLISFPFDTYVVNEPPTAVDGISWTTIHGLRYTLKNLVAFESGIYIPLAWFLTLVAIYYVLTNTSTLNFRLLNYTPKRKFDKSIVSATLLFQFLAVSPLFILGCDYGRWVFFWATSSFALILIIPQEKLLTILPKLAFSASEKINTFLSKYLNSKIVLLLCLIIGFPGFSWNLNSVVNSSFIVMLLKSIFNVFTTILSI
ncbi:hypothetical protein [Pedobacter xixiisoli]|uniref:Uncharacterized protein n=1 Tax=Pedobacter xixiisoli TaxID=1476464 RepID=A0A285ZZB5_9SPHI|nr:hypothetical protein [Pedobacter xixiisoli]SOD14990.1 hypothetical protein SAMN06297358_1958 [Pedobacter xixiisoli]